MAQIIWTEPALDDLNDVAEYIALSNPIAAQNLVARIFEKVERLELFPESGRVPKEVKELGYREIIVNPCRVFYKTDAEKVYVLHLLRQERQLRNYILDNETPEAV